MPVFQKMSKEPDLSTTPWKNGIWASKITAFMLVEVNGEKIQCLNVASLDFPEMEPVFSGDWKFGDFGAAREEVRKASGVDRYNIMVFLVILFLI